MSRKQKRLDRMQREYQQAISPQAKPVRQSDEKRWAIAKLVRSIDFPGLHGGKCYLRALTGSIVLDRFNIDHKLVLGGLLYRAGYQPWDLLMFAGEDNRGHHPDLYHCWLESGEDLIDFSCGDWQRVTKVHSDVEINPSKLPHITWTVPPPEFIWQQRAPLIDAWRPPPYGPPPGGAWYGPIAEHNQEMLDEGKALALPQLIDAVDRIFLKFGLPVCKIFFSDKDRDDYMKQNKLVIVE